jgi:hypothetical protein
VAALEKRAWIALTALLVVGGVFLLHETRGTTFWFDEWTWILERRGADVDTLLQPHNGHLSLVGVAIYKLLFATAGLDHHAPYCVVVIAAHLACVTLMFAYARRRVGGIGALLAAALVLFFGPGWPDVLWPFQTSWLISLAAGVGCLLAFDRADRAGDALSSVLLALSLASASLGIPIALGMFVELWLGRRRWRDAWVVVAPLALYALWWVPYHDTSTFARHSIVATPAYVADAAAAVTAALAGLGGPVTLDNGGTLLDWGRPLVVAVAALLAWRLARVRPISPRVLTLLTITSSFWVLTALNRAALSPPYSNRYLYVGAFFVLLLGVEVARGARVSARVGAVLAVAAAAAIVSNIGAFRDGGRYLRSSAQNTTADLGALELARPLARPDTVATGLPGYPLLVVRAGPYFSAERSLGSPAATPTEIPAKSAAARRGADLDLIAIHRVALRQSAPQPRGGTRPRVERVAGGVVADGGPACLVFAADAVGPTGVGHDVDITLPRAGVWLAAQGGPVIAGVRRFGDDFQPIGGVAAGASAALRIAPDLAADAWHLRFTPARRVIVCGLE